MINVSRRGSTRGGVKLQVLAARDLASNYGLGLQVQTESIDQVNPLEHHRRLTAERRQLTAACRSRLKHPLKRWLFTASLRRAQKLAVNREV